MLIICVHVQGGQPARGTELLSIRFRNGTLQDRNVFVVNGQVAVITRYHKSQSMMDRPKIVPRFLPWRCGQLLTVYLAYVQPFQEYLRQVHMQQRWSDHLWYTNKGPWETDQLTMALQHETAAGLGQAYGTLDYRHIAVSVGREVIGDAFAAGYKEEIGEVEEPEVEEESALELQSGRGEAVGSSKYGVPVDIVNNLSVKSLEAFRKLSDAWHQFLHLDSGHDDPLSRTHRSIPAAVRGHKRELTLSASEGPTSRPFVASTLLVASHRPNREVRLIDRQEPEADRLDMGPRREADIDSAMR